MESPLRQTLTFMLNMPWTMLGMVCGALSIPRYWEVNKDPLALVVRVRGFWWCTWMPSKRGLRGLTYGNVVLLGPDEMEKDLEHELVHVEQYQREPLIHPYLYSYELGRHGYMNNKYEQEAYKRAGNPYIKQQSDT